MIENRYEPPTLTAVGTLHDLTLTIKSGGQEDSLSGIPAPGGSLTVIIPGG